MIKLPFLPYVLAVVISLICVLGSVHLLILSEFRDSLLVEVAVGHGVLMQDVFMLFHCRVGTVDLGLVHCALKLIIGVQSLQLALAVTLELFILLEGELSLGVNLLCHLGSLGVESNLLPHLLFLHGKLLKPVFKQFLLRLLLPHRQLLNEFAGGIKSLNVLVLNSG